MTTADTTADTIARAIAERRPIRFTYSGKPREADPHAMYAHPTTGTILVDAYQHGFSALGETAFWRQFAVAKVVDLVVADETFEVDSGYRADSPRYVAALAKVGETPILDAFTESQAFVDAQPTNRPDDGEDAKAGICADCGRDSGHEEWCQTTGDRW